MAPSRHLRWRFLILAGVWFALTHPGLSAEDPNCITGLLYFAVEDLENGQVIDRGTTGSQGFAFDQLNVPADRKVRIWILRAENLEVGHIDVLTPPAGERQELPAITVHDASGHDSDMDRLSDVGEFIIGSNSFAVDTDGDGVSDSAEVQQGLNPLGDQRLRTGIIGSSDTTGTAVDIAAVDDLAIVADSEGGVSFFNIFNGMNPVIIAQVDTPAPASAVASSGNLAAVACGRAGLIVIDASDPPAARIRHQILQGNHAQSVATAGNIAFCGFNSGLLALIDMASGNVLDTLAIDSEPVDDLSLAGDHLFALGRNNLYALSYDRFQLSVLSSVESPGGVNVQNGRKRLFVGGNIAYTTHRQGYNTFDVSDPAVPQLLGHEITSLFGFKHIVSNGSGLGFVAVSPNQAFDGPHHVSLYDVSDPTQVNVPIIEFPTPGVARAVSIFNGLGYVADNNSGLQVVNYQASDVQKNPPTIALRASFPLDPGEAEEGKLVRVTAEVNDDVQVRNVEFFVDGTKVFTDGNFPFEHRFVTPRRTDQLFFTLRAHASDTGGNITTTANVTIQLTEDLTPPQLLRMNPQPDSFVFEVMDVSAGFNEAMSPVTITPTSFAVREAGPDLAFDTGDDVPVEGALRYREDLFGAVHRFENGLASGLYRATVSPPLSDAAGNPMAEPVTWQFAVVSAEDQDSDSDGLPDTVEILLGLDPNNADSDGNGVGDGEEDFDGDNLPNRVEVRIGTHLLVADSDGDGITDEAEDLDLDGLSNLEEIGLGTDPLVADSDGDGWPDGAERDGDSNPLDPDSIPVFLVTSPQPSVVTPLQNAEGVGGIAVSPQSPSVVLPEEGAGGVAGMTVAQPPTNVEFQSQ